MNYTMLIDLIKYNNIKVYMHSKVIDIDQQNITFFNNDSKQTLICDSVINAVGYKSDHSIYEEIKDIDKEVYNIGDSRMVRNVMYAIWDAYEVARNV